MAVLRPSLECGCEVWNANKCQAKALESIQLRACKYILGCSITTCDEPVLADLGLETLKYRRDFRKLKWHYKIKHMNDERLPFKLLANERDKVKSKGQPRKCWIAHVNSLRKELDLQDKILERKLIKEALDRRECEEFEMALRHKSKLLVYKELKRGVGFEEYLRYVKGPTSRLFLSSIRVPMGFLRNCVGMLRGVDLRNVLIVGLVRSLLSMFFLSVHHTIPRDKIFWTI